MSMVDAPVVRRGGTAGSAACAAADKHRHGHADDKQAEDGQRNTAGRRTQYCRDGTCPERGQDRRPCAAQDRECEQRHRPAAAAVGLPLAGHAQQLVGLLLRNSPAQIRSASLMVRYGAQMSARASTLIRLVMA